MEPTAGTLETRKDAGTTPGDTVAYWLAQDKLAETELRDWQKRGRKVVKRYRDERASSQMRSGAKFNILWANVQVLKPVLYARTPKPDIAPRWIDTDEEVVRLAAMILERALTFICDRYDVDSVIKSCVEDRILPGLGIARVRYKPTFGEPQPDPDATEEGATYRPVEKEEVCWEYVFWEDVAWSPARRWEEVTWLRFRSFMTRQELIDRFGATIGEAVPLDYTPKGMEKEELPPDMFKKATVYEFWDKTKKQVVWIAKDYKDRPLDTVSDPLNLYGFYPCPKPLLATTTNDKVIPVPDFAQYQDQADELDTLAARIDKLTRALKVAGVYAASEKASLQQLLEEATDNMLIPVEDWAQFTQQKGGLEGTIVWLPIKTIAEVLEKLYQAFDRQKEQLYEVSGLSDIMRGATEASETATAQRLKSQYGSIRVQDSQKEVGRFARDLFRLAGEVISEHLDPKTISEMTGLPELPKPVPQPTPPAMPALQPQAAGIPTPAASQPTSPQPQVAPAPSPMPTPSPAPMAPAAQPGAGATPPASQGATPPVPSSQDPMALFQQQTQAFQAYQAEVQRKTDQFTAACELLKQDALRTFRLDIEADSTIAPDEQAEQEGRVQFVEAIGQLLQQAVPFVQQMPQAGGALISEILKFLAHGFRAGRSLEETIDKFADYLDKLPPPAPHTDPALIKAETDAKIAQQKLQADTEMAQIKQAGEDQREQQRLQIEAQRAAVDTDRIKSEMLLKEQTAKDDLAVKLAKVAADERVATHAAHLEHARKQEQLARDDQFKRESAEKSMAAEKARHAASEDFEREKAGMQPRKPTGPVKRRLLNVEKGADGRVTAVQYQDEPAEGEAA